MGVNGGAQPLYMLGSFLVIKERWLLVCKYQQLRKLDFQPVFHASWSENPNSSDYRHLSKMDELRLLAKHHSVLGKTSMAAVIFSYNDANGSSLFTVEKTTKGQPLVINKTQMSSIESDTKGQQNPNEFACPPPHSSTHNCNPIDRYSPTFIYQQRKNGKYSSRSSVERSTARSGTLRGFGNMTFRFQITTTFVIFRL
uniref:Uncharacterized protein n=1 Tax=Nelumbo nucifera TaxID=4432 RepID=A0A822YU95_NELNU|nr:TPA_asm: hypothetical protein HUJ06_006747 [Nelumbo nucifera]